jgi:hypothetical protein
MGRFIRTIAGGNALHAGAILGAFLTTLAPEAALAGAPELTTQAATPTAPIRGSQDPLGTIDSTTEESTRDESWTSHQPTAAEVVEARAYVLETAQPGYTMTRQGPELAIERLHPEFVVRLAKAIREAREAGLTKVGVFSAYRPPAFGIGGFSDKFNSLHAYGLAVDMQGIGGPGSAEAKQWHQIAASNGVVCPYGPANRAEWNHCQPTSLKAVIARNPLRETISADGPRNLVSMFEVGSAVIENPAHGLDAQAADITASVITTAQEKWSISAINRRQARRQTVANVKSARHVRQKASRTAARTARLTAEDKRRGRKVARKSERKQRVASR